jgi:hypothetical protein
MNNYIFLKNDWDLKAIDVVLCVNNKEYWISGFDDNEWSQAEEFAEQFANSLNVQFIGDRTDT